MVINRRFLAVVAWCQELAIPVAVLALLVTAGSPANNSYALMTANMEAAPVSATLTRAIEASAEMPMSANTVADIPIRTDEAPAAAAPVLAALEMPAERQPENRLDVPVQTNGSIPLSVDVSMESPQFADECIIIDTCVDEYLWQLYQRTPKEDSVREKTQKQVTVKRKGKLVTVTRTSSTVVDQDFGWKDGNAAAKAGMSLKDYVIGGVDRNFKLRLFQMLHAAEQDGLTPGITSVFRDDYRQSIANGLKAANDRSFHGGSFRGGYGHGLAADIVGVKGATRAERLNSSQQLWKWVDGHGSEFGIARPYLGRDPPHVAPIDGEEFAKHRPRAKIRTASARRG